MNPIYAATAVAISAAVALAITHETAPPAQHPIVVAAAPVEEAIAPKSDLEPVVHVVRTVPVPVSTVDASVVAPVIVTPPTMIVEQAARDRIAKPVQSPRTGHLTIHSDICAAHGGHRVDDPVRRSWHCVFPKRS